MATGVKRELVISILIDGHGREDYLNPFDRDSEIGQYYRNNVIVHSTSAVPDISALMSAPIARTIIGRIIDKFSEVPASETREIVNAFAREIKKEYQDLAFKHEHLDTTDRVGDPKYLSEVSNLIAYLANKEYFFYKTVRGDKIEDTCGITITDIRQKITHVDGEVSYEIVRFPAREFNLIHKIGVESFAELLLNNLGIGQDVDLETIFRILGFSRRTDTLASITLVELYEFFKLLEIDYVNIFDLTCRDCKTRKLTEDEIADIGNAEFFVSRNAKAFGDRTKKRRNKKNKKKKKTRNNI